MIYIVHGTDYSKSRKLIINQKNNSASEHIIEKNIEDIEPRELYENLVSFDLFGNPPFVVLKVPGTKIAGFDAYAEVIKKTPDTATLIILASGTLGNSNDFIKTAAKFKAKVISNTKETKSNVFDFVDSVFYKNRFKAYEEYKTLIDEDNDPFYIFSMILYGLRNVTHAKFNTNEFQVKKGYGRDKSERQANNFTKFEILNIFKECYKTDKDLKTGKIDKDLAIPYLVEKICND